MILRRRPLLTSIPLIWSYPTGEIFRFRRNRIDWIISNGIGSQESMIPLIEGSENEIYIRSQWTRQDSSHAGFTTAEIATMAGSLNRASDTSMAC